MEKKDYLKIAKEYSIKTWNFDIVHFAGEENGWYYYSCTREGRPHYSSMPVAIRVNHNGEIEELPSSLWMKVNADAYRLLQSQY